jgi:hypothetical protein
MISALKYSEKFKSIIMSGENIHYFTGVSDDGWCELTGLWLKTGETNLISKSEIVIEGKYPVFSMRGKSKNVVEIDFEVDIFNRTLFGHEFHLSSRGNKHGFYAFAKILEIASWLGLEKILCIAHRDEFGQVSDGGKHITEEAYNGYITWAQFGFTMTRASRMKFREFLNSKNLNYKSLAELLEAPTGFNFWKENGFAWNGEFKLKKSSRNWQLWNRYKAQIKPHKAN